MAIRLILTLRPSSPPHLYLDQIKEIIKDDNQLMPAMQKCLLLMKKHRKTYIQLPIQVEVLLITDMGETLERSLNPTFGMYSKTLWSENDKAEYFKDYQKFMDKIKNTYVKMGYEVQQSYFDDEMAKSISKDIKPLE